MKISNEYIVEYEHYDTSGDFKPFWDKRKEIMNVVDLCSMYDCSYNKNFKILQVTEAYEVDIEKLPEWVEYKQKELEKENERKARQAARERLYQEGREEAEKKLFLELYKKYGGSK